MKYSYYKQLKNGNEKLVKCSSEKFITALSGAKRDTRYTQVSSGDLTHKEKLAATVIEPRQFAYLYDILDSDAHICARFKTFAQANQYLFLVNKSLFHFSEVDKLHIRKILVIYLDNGYTCEYVVN